MLRYGAILTCNTSLTNRISLKIKLLPRNLSSARSVLTSFRNFHLETPKACAIRSNETSDDLKSPEKFKIANILNEKYETAPQHNNDAIEEGTKSAQIHQHVRSRDKYSLTDIERMYKNPKSKLHDIYQGVNNQLSSNCLNYEYVKPKIHKSTWTCNVKVTWPENMVLSSTGVSKSLAAHSASLKLLHYLENKRKLNRGKPIIYSTADIKEIINKPIPLNITNQALEGVKFIVDKYQTEIKDLIDQSERHSGESASSKHYESYFETTVTVDPVGRSNPTNKTPRKIAERNALLKKRYENRILSQTGSDLPITEYQDKIIEEIEKNQVVLIKGDTGCGKTTQVPQFIIDSFVKKGQATDCNIIVAEPRRISAISLAERIASERKELIGDVIGYQVRLTQELPNTPAGILFCTTGMLLRKLQFNTTLEGCSHVIIDEAHERTINTDMLLVLLKRTMELNKNLKVIVMSATINADLFQQYFNCNCIEIPGRTFPVTPHFLNDIDKIGLKSQHSYSGMVFDDHRPMTASAINDVPVIDLVKIGELIVHITNEKPPGAILCFLPGWAEITQLKKYLEEYSQLASMRKQFMVVPLHSKVAHFDQRKVFDKPPEHVRKIILATDIAETGITVSDVVYVVDSCTHRQVQWHEKLGLSSISNKWASQANVNQRKGRAGRVQAGISYHFVTKEMFEKMDPYPIPEVMRSSLEKTVLDAKTYSSNEKAHDFLGKMPQPPDPMVITQAVRNLVDLGALDQYENLTPLGKRIAFFTIDPKLSKALLYSSIFNCVGPMLTITAAMSAESEIFTGILQNKEAVRKVKEKYHPSSDHASVVWLYQHWNSHAMSGRYQARDFCFKSRLYPDRMYTMSKVRELYGQHLLHARMFDEVKNMDDFNSSINDYAELDELVRGVLLSGVDQLLQHRDFEIRQGQMKKGSSTFITEDGNKATITPDSVNFKRKLWPSPYLTYVRSTHSEERRTSLIRETSMISPLTVFLFSQSQLLGYLSNPSETNTEENEENIIFTMRNKRNIKLICNKETATTLLKFRDAMWDVVRYMVSHQGLSIPQNAHDYQIIRDFKTQLLQVLGRMLSEAAVFIDDPENGVKPKKGKSASEKSEDAEYE